MKTTQEAVSRYSSIVLFCLAVWFGQSQLFAFNIGDRVQANGLVYVRSTAGGTYIGTQAGGTRGTVLAGPIYAQIGGTGAYYYWYNIDWPAAPDGWVADVGLILVTVSAPIVQTLPPTSITPSSAQINGSVNPNGASTTAYFQYGNTTAYGNTSGSLSGITTTMNIYLILTGLWPNTTYHYRVVAYNSGGTSYGSDVTFTTPGSIPTVQTLAAITSPSTSSALLNARIMDNGGSSILERRFSWGTTQACSDGSTSAVLVNGSDFSFNLQELAPGTYYFQAWARNSAGWGNSSPASFTLPPAPVPTVQTLAASGVTTSSAQLNGNVNPNGSSTTVYFQYGTTASYGYTTGSGNFGSGTITLTAVSTITGLAASTLFHYRIVANNAGGPAYGNDMTFTASGAVPTVQTLAATTSPATSSAIVNGRITDIGTSSILERRFSWGTTPACSDGFTSAVSVNGSDFSFNLQELAPGTYYFQAWARNSAGWGNSSAASFTLPPAPVPTVQTLAASLVTTSSAQLNGNVNPNGSTTTAYFQYGTTTSYGFTTGPGNYGSGTITLGAVSPITGLAANTLFHCRIVANNAGGPAYGSDMTFTTLPSNQPNLTAYLPPGWSDKIVVSRARGNNTDSTSLTTADTLYVDWAVVNNGNAAATSTFYTYLFVDDVLRQSWSTAPMNANYYTAAFDFPIGSLSAGPHTIRTTTDATGVITEGSEADNSYTKTINVGGTSVPDFIITGITLSPTVPQPGQAFTATVTVKNQGLASGDGKWLDVWANQSSVPACGTDGNTWATVGVLSQNQIKPFTLNLTAPATAGSYTLRAFVDSYCQTAEANDGNNQATATYTVGSVSPTPNFVVTAITFNPAQPVGGQPFRAYVTVKNQGTVSGDGKYLDVWVNQPSPQACGASGNQHQSVGTLPVNQPKMLTFNLTASASGGPWAFRAFVDSTCQTPESNDGDNQMTVSYGINPVALPDFRITSIDTSPGPSQPLPPGTTFFAYITVTNQGAGSGDAGWLEVWANKPTAANCGESGDTYPKVGVLAAGASKVLTVSLTAGPAAVNTLRAFVDSKCETTESDEGNNQFTSTYAPAVEVWSLTVAAQDGVIPTAAQWTSVSDNFKLAANYLCDATDGQFRLGNIFLYNAGAQIATADVKVQLTTVDRAFTYMDLVPRVMVLGISSLYYHSYNTITHELGHYKFGLGDEYTAYRICDVWYHVNPLYDHNKGDWVNKNKQGHSDLATTCPACIMDNQNTSEFCIHNEQFDNHVTTTNPESNQQEKNRESCWETIAGTNPQIHLPAAAPLPGPCETMADSKLPLGVDEGVAVFVKITGP